MPTPKPIRIDFETEAIERRPEYPPKPVGVAIDKRYYSWGHPTGNNCDKRDGQRALQAAYKSGEDILFQNGKFDVDVAEQHMGLAVPSWERIHDTLFLLFLHDPHARNLSLKPSAERILGMAPEERDVVRDWLVDHKIVKKKQKDWGAHISKAPGNVVGPYAIGDNTRTGRLFAKLYPEIQRRGMMQAYDRERRLMPILLRNEREGVCVNVELLERDVKRYTHSLDFADNWLRKRLRSPNLNVDSDREVAAAFERADVVREWKLTKTGQNSVSKKNLTLDMFADKKVASVYGYRNRLATCLRMFMEPWLLQALATGGRIHTSWNQVRQNHGAEQQAGARTGRLSSTPNFQNIPKTFEDRGDGYVHPKFLPQLLPLPLLRMYLLPDGRGQVWGHRDYSQQELRILAHYEDGDLLAAYLANPKLDVHGIVHRGIADILHLNFIRTRVKNFVFQNIYGGGVPAVCEALGCDPATAKRVINVLMQVLPGYGDLKDAVMDRGRAGEDIRTWGGRQYYTEEPHYVEKYNRFMTFEYKLLNYLIQGSAADCTKEALIRYDAHPKRNSRMLLTVHDEINCSMPKRGMRQEMKVLQEVMQSVEFDLPMLSEGKYGPNWGTLTKL